MTMSSHSSSVHAPGTTDGAPLDVEMARAIVLEHDANPRSFGVMTDPDRTVRCYNPFCGDRYDLYFRMKDDRIVEASFHGFGCALSRASASMLVSAVTGRSLDEVRSLATAVRTMLDQGPVAPGLADLAARAVMRSHPSRVRCAWLSWEAVCGGLLEADET
jgi:nitrogen fixation NifU-like protein